MVRGATGRAIQLDAQRLDDELQSLLLQEWRLILRKFPRSPLNSLTAEVTLLLRFLLHSNSLGANKPTPGTALQNLAFVDMRGKRPVLGLTRIQRIGHFLLDVLVPYIFEKLRHRGWSSTSRIVTWLETGYKIVALGNLLAFLRTGVYHTLSHRVLRTGLAHPTPTRPQRTAFEIVDRQLVWQGLAEFALFLAPVVKRLIKGIAFGAGIRRMQGEGLCVGCGETAVMPHVAIPCRCRYCYVCGRGMTDGVGSFCGGCGGVVGGVERLRFG